MNYSDAERTEMIARADRLYAARANLTNVNECVKLLCPIEFEAYEAAWRAGRAHFFLGQEARTRKEKRGSHQRGVSTCERAVSLEPQRVEGHFWLGVNLALLAPTENIFRAARHALRARSSLMQAAAIDRLYHAAGPLRVLARLEQRLPGLFGGGALRARGHYEEAIGLAPANTVTRLYFADLLLELGEEAAARQHLEAVIAAVDDPFWTFEIERDKELAIRMLAGLNRTVTGEQ